MTRGLTLIVAVAGLSVAAAPAVAQQVGDPFPFITAGTSTAVALFGTCDDNGQGGDRYRAYSLGGATIFAAASPGGTPLAILPLPAGTLSAEQLAGYCPGTVVPGPPPGIYWVVMVYGLPGQTSAPASAWKQVVVGPNTCTSPPLPPLHVPGSPSISGSNVTLTYSGSAFGCPIGRVDLEVGTTPGGRELGPPFQIPGLNSFFPSVPPGTYYLRARGVNAFGTGNVSLETPLRVPGPCAPSELPPPRVNPAVTVNGRQVTIAWTLSPASGATFHQIALLQPGTAAVTDHLMLSSATSVTVPNVSPGNYRIQVWAGNACGMRAMVPLSYLDFTVQ